MFVEERQNLILEELQEKGRVRVKELSERFSVTEDLIRKDLSVLERDGKCKKIYGGAMIAKENVLRKTTAQRKDINLDCKEQVARKAFEKIKPGNVIFLDISTTVAPLARLIAQSDLEITVVTNALEVVNTLVNSSVNLIFAGGEFDYGKDGFVGSLTNRMLEDFHFDMAFMGVVGVDLEENAVYTYMANDGVTKHLVLSRSKESYMMCDHDKFNQIGNYRYAGADEFDGLITDKPLSAAKKKLCKEYNLEVTE